MFRPTFFLLWLLLPAAVILLSIRSPLERRLPWAIACIAGGVLLVAAALATPHVAAGRLPADVAGSLGMLLLFAAAIVPWLVVVAFRRVAARTLRLTHR